MKRCKKCGALFKALNPQRIYCSSHSQHFGKVQKACLSKKRLAEIVEECNKIRAEKERGK